MINDSDSTVYCITYRSAFTAVAELMLVIKHHHQNLLPKGRSFTASAGTKAAVLLKADFHSKIRNQAAVLPGMNRCGSFPLLSAPHSLFSIWTNLTRSKKIPVVPTWRWLTGPSGLHRNSPQGLNIISIKVFDQVRDPEIPITFGPPEIKQFFIILL